MYYSKLNLTIITFACLGAIGLALVVKISHENENKPILSPVLQNTTDMTPILKVAETFFKNYVAQDNASTSQKEVVQTKPVSKIKVIEGKNVTIPGITAEAYLVGNASTGQIYLEHNGTESLPIASMSKLITALTAMDTIRPDQPIEVTKEETATYPDPSNLEPGEKFTMPELLYPLLLDSSNVAAEALASSTNRAQFIEDMSSYSWEIGLTKSYFADPSGLSPHNKASPEGFFALAQYLYKSRPDILALTRVKTFSFATTTDHGSHELVNIHPFVNVPGYIGGKTGHTDDAGDTMLTILNVSNKPVAFIVLNSSSGMRASDTYKLIDWLNKSGSI